MDPPPGAWSGTASADVVRIQRATVKGWTPTCQANSFWVSPDRRNSRTKLLNLTLIAPTPAPAFLRKHPLPSPTPHHPGNHGVHRTLTAMARVQVNASQLTEYLTEVFKPSDPTDEGALIRAERNRDWAEHFFDEGRGNRLPGVRGTLWAAFNGVTELLDHRKTRQTPGQRLNSLWFGENYRLKARAFSLAQEKMEVWLN